MTGYGESAEIAADLTLEDVAEPLPSWYRGVALTILSLSILTAISALLAGLVAHDTLLDRTEEIMGVAFSGDDHRDCHCGDGAGTDCAPTLALVGGHSDRCCSGWFPGVR
ncbi:MAG: hypothetical protein M3112_04520, partial [Actinomycetia bacterium]|nr:hypothetical protein [Actinomycetes bacterium]